MSQSERVRPRVPVGKRGYDVIRDPMLNKGSAFTPRERSELGLDGLLPPQHNTIEQQARRIHASLAAKPTDLEKYIGLASLQDRNEHLYYRVLCDHLEELMPIVYTPTVGEATREFSHVFRRGRGVWITPNFRGRIAEVLRAAVADRPIRLIVATDNESILGIGDQGAGGMAISIGKLALYTAGAGIHPGATLPVSLDVGTDNDGLLEDDLYLGWPERRLRGADYDGLVAEFVAAVRAVFPGALIQWEDFRKDNALRILDRYREQVPSFNDDIQGTGAVALAGLLTAGRLTGRSLTEERVVVFGAGAAGLGIARQIRAAMAEAGLEGLELLRRMAVFDSRGLLIDSRDIRDEYKRELAWPAELGERLGAGRQGGDLAALVERLQPTVLIGSSGQPGAFTEQIVRRMARHVERPLILPFSNPTELAEARPADLIHWTDGRALVATGSPFRHVEWRGQTVQIGQGNNVFIFPGLGLGALQCRARRVSDGMIGAAARALAATVTGAELDRGQLYPSIARLREVSAAVAVAVIRQALEESLAAQRPSGDLEQIVRAAMWEPDYPEYVAG